MDDVTLLPLKFGIYAVMALFALGAAWTLRTRHALPSSHRLPHEFAITNLLGVPALFWGLGAMASLARPHANIGHVHMEAVITLCVMVVAMFGLVAVVSTRRFALRSLVLYHTLIWGGLISGISLMTQNTHHVPKVFGASLCSLLLCSIFTLVLMTHKRCTTPQLLD